MKPLGNTYHYCHDLPTPSLVPPALWVCWSFGFSSPEAVGELLSFKSPEEMDVSENGGFSPQIIHFNSVFHYFHHPFFGYPYFWKHPNVGRFLYMTPESWKPNSEFTVLKVLMLWNTICFFLFQAKKGLNFQVRYCAHEICVPAAGVPPAEHANAKTPSTETGKNENAKTRKRRKRENGENTIHSVVLWTRTLSQIWACVGMYASSPFRILRTQTLSQLWACVKYAPKQPSP